MPGLLEELGFQGPERTLFLTKLARIHKNMIEEAEKYTKRAGGVDG